MAELFTRLCSVFVGMLWLHAFVVVKQEIPGVCVFGVGVFEGSISSPIKLESKLHVHFFGRCFNKLPFVVIFYWVFCVMIMRWGTNIYCR